MPWSYCAMGCLKGYENYSLKGFGNFYLWIPNIQKNTGLCTLAVAAPVCVWIKKPRMNMSGFYSTNLGHALHDDIFTWKHFPHYWPFVWGIHQSPVNSPPPPPHTHTKASDAELWCFLWSAPEQMVEWTTEMMVIWDTIALIMTSL